MNRPFNNCLVLLGILLCILVGSVVVLIPNLPVEDITWTPSPTNSLTQTSENDPVTITLSFTPTSLPTFVPSLTLMPPSLEPTASLPATLSPTAVSTELDETPKPEFLVGTYEELLGANSQPGQKTIYVKGRIEVRKTIQLTAGTTLTGWDETALLTNTATYTGPIMQVANICPSSNAVWNVVVYNMRFDRTPTPGFLGTNGDSFSVVRSCNVWLDHNSMRHGSDGNLDVTECTRCKITNNIIAEAIRRGFHRDSAGNMDEHSMGMIITACIECEVAGNMFISNKERNPRIDGCDGCLILNNLIVNPRSTPSIISCPSGNCPIIYSGNVLLWRVDSASTDLIAISGTFTGLWVDNLLLVRASDRTKLSQIPYRTDIPQYRPALDIMTDVGALPRDAEDARLIKCSTDKTCEIIDWS